ncbi:hypothetical protein [Streptomyces sp. NPDC057939]
MRKRKRISLEEIGARLGPALPAFQGAVLASVLRNRRPTPNTGPAVRRSA